MSIEVILDRLWFLAFSLDLRMLELFSSGVGSFAALAVSCGWLAAHLLFVWSWDFDFRVVRILSWNLRILVLHLTLMSNLANFVSVLLTLADNFSLGLNVFLLLNLFLSGLFCYRDLSHCGALEKWCVDLFNEGIEVADGLEGLLLNWCSHF